MVTLITLPILYLAVDRDRQASLLLERVTRDSSLKTWLRVLGLERMGRDGEYSVYSVYYTCIDRSSSIPDITKGYFIDKVSL
jgi:hypothetical protein